MTDESLIESAVKAAQRIEAANKVQAELVKRLENIEQSRLLGGAAEAGQQKPQLSQEDKDLQDTKAYFKGSAIERAFK